MNKTHLELQLRLIRRAYRRTRQVIRFHSLENSPIFFANSFPKSGTHLLTQVMQGLSQIGPAVNSGLLSVTTFDGFTGRQRSETEVMTDLNRFLPGDIGYGHVHAFRAATYLLNQDNFATYFILRDPRDVVVSHVYYVAAMASNHVHHRYYHEILNTFDERLSASIAGVPTQELQKAAGSKPVYLPLPDIRSRFDPFMEWLDQPNILILRYENMMINRRETLNLVLEHAVRHGFFPACSTDQALDRLASSIDPRLSPTFRSGKIGGWRQTFNDDHNQLFSRITGDLLKRLGYENS